MKEPNFKDLKKPTVKDLAKIIHIHEQIDDLILGSDLHEDFIQFLLYPFERILTENGINLDEIDY